MKNLPIKVIIAGAIGGAIEFYDFTLYGILAPSFADLYFPSTSKTFSIISAYIVFAVGFLARPIGAVVFGRLGDLKGRKTALFSSLLLMSFSTLLIGILPSYDSIGILAPISMILSRLMQGVSAGGEYSGALIFTIEHSDQSKTGLTGSLVTCGCMCGLLLGSLASLWCGLPGMPQWCWRIPFIIGFFVSVVGVYIRHSLQETPTFLEIVKAKQKQSLVFRNIKDHAKNIFFVILISGFNGIAIYVYFVFMSSFVSQSANISEIQAKLYSAIGTALLMSMLVLFGWLSDLVGRAKLMRMGAILTIIISVIFFNILPYCSKCLVLPIQIIFVISLGMFSGPLNTFVIEVFSGPVRYRCAAVGYSLGMGVIGGMAPFVASMLSLSNYKEILLSIYFVISGSIAFFSVFQSRREGREAGEAERTDEPEVAVRPVSGERRKVICGSQVSGANLVDAGRPRHLIQSSRKARDILHTEVQNVNGARDAIVAKQEKTES